MNPDELRNALAAALSPFRKLTHAELADAIRSRKGCLGQQVFTASDGTECQIEFLAVWDETPGGTIRVIADLSRGRLLFGFLPVDVSDVTDDFLVPPDAPRCR